MTTDAPDGPEEVVGAPIDRTEMAWVRTALATGGLAVVATRLTGRDTGLVLALTFGALIAAPGLVATWWRVRGLRAHEPAPPSIAGVAMVVGSVILVDTVVLVSLVA